MLSLNSRRKYSTGGEFACKSMFRPVRSLKSSDGGGISASTTGCQT